MERDRTKREQSPLRSMFEELNECHSLLNQLERIPESKLKEALTMRVKAVLDGDSLQLESENSKLKIENTELKQQLSRQQARIDKLYEEASDAGPGSYDVPVKRFTVSPWLWLVAVSLVIAIVRWCVFH